MLPKINSTRKNKIKLGTKIITLSAWSNSTIIEYESIEDNSQEVIREYLITPYIETKSKLTLLEERYVLLELYRLSKSNLLDISYTCNECETRSNYVLSLDKVYNYHELKERVIKVDNYIFNLKSSSNYQIDTNNDNSKELIHYLVSFIDDIMIKGKTYEVTSMDETTDWLLNEVPNNIFNELLLKFNEIQPKLDIEAYAICEHCSSSQKLNFTGVESFLK